MSLPRPIVGLAVVAATVALGLAAPAAQAAPSHAAKSSAAAAAKSKATPKPKPDPLAKARTTAAARIATDIAAVKRWKTLEASDSHFNLTERTALVGQANAALVSMNNGLAAVKTAKTAAGIAAWVASADYSVAAVSLARHTYLVTEPPLARLDDVSDGLELLVNQVADLPEGPSPTVVNQAIDDAMDAGAMAEYKVDMARAAAIGAGGAPSRARLLSAQAGVGSWLSMVNGRVVAAEEALAVAQDAYDDYVSSL